VPSTREIRNRIRSVKNIGQITRALEAVSASRVRKAQAQVLASRAYSEKAIEILQNVQLATRRAPVHPLLTPREQVDNIMVILMTSDRGLAGAFNTNIIRVAQRFTQRMGKPVQYVTIGRKGRDALHRMGENIVADFSGDIPDEPRVADLRGVDHLAKEAYLSGEVDDVYIAYTDFINTLTQRPVVFGWLPMIPRHMESFEYVKDVLVVEIAQDYQFEPSPEAIVDEIVPRFTELALYQMLLESKASEHSARMVAMRNASDNAVQLVGDLTLVYNKARQAAITNEILDIVGGAEALQEALDKAAKSLLDKFEQAPHMAGVQS
jgi:F-type H+-transporting ATPase subunit gamma